MENNSLNKIMIDYLSPKYNLMYNNTDEIEYNYYEEEPRDVQPNFRFFMSSSFSLPQMIIITGIQRLLQQEFQGENPTEPLTIDKFNTLPTLKKSDLSNYFKDNNINNDIPNDCCICQVEFDDDRELVVLPKCNHIFDKECIKVWLTERHHLCPICRTDCN